MKLTIQQLRSIIKEEVESVIAENAEPLSEGLRTPSELGRILKAARIGYVLDYVRVFRGPRGAAKVGVVTKVAKDGQPGAYTFKLGRSVEEFDTADDLAYGIGDFDVL